MRLDWTPHNAAAFQLDTDPRWALLGLSGHGAPDTQVRTVATPERDEQIPLHAPAQPRLLTLTLAIRGDTLAAYEVNRATLAAAFAPWRDTGVRARPGTLTATLADGRVRALRAFPRQGLAWGAGRQHGAHTVESISLEAPDPFWYDPTPQTGSVTTAGPGNLRFDAATELGFPAGFGSDLPSVTATLANPGSVRSFPVWTVPGPSVNPSLRQAATGHTLAFDLTVPAGLSLRVRCGPQPRRRRRPRCPSHRRPRQRNQRPRRPPPPAPASGPSAPAPIPSSSARRDPKPPPPPPSPFSPATLPSEPPPHPTPPHDSNEEPHG